MPAGVDNLRLPVPFRRPGLRRVERRRAQIRCRVRLLRGRLWPPAPLPGPTSGLHVFLDLRIPAQASGSDDNKPDLRPVLGAAFRALLPRHPGPGTPGAAQEAHSHIGPWTHGVHKHKQRQGLRQGAEHFWGLQDPGLRPGDHGGSLLAGQWTNGLAEGALQGHQD